MSQRRRSSIQQQQQPLIVSGLSTTARGWEWAASVLWKAATAGGERRCCVPTTDWVVVAHESGGAAVRWVTTSKSGAVARKKLRGSDAALPVAEIGERFARLASRWAALGAAQTPGDAPFIAALVLQDGSRQLLTPVAFQEWLDKLEAAAGAGAAADVAGLQAYVPPCARSLTPACVSAMYSSSVEYGSRVDVTGRDAYCVAPAHAPASTGSEASVVPSRFRKEAQSAALAVVDALQRAAGEHVLRAVFEFVVDCEQKLWLTHVERLEVEPTGGGAGAPAASSAFEPASLGARKQSLPALQSSGSGASASDTRGAKCRGEFCRTAPALLPGLFFASLSESESGDGAAADDDGDNNSSSPMDVSALPDTGQRFKVGNNAVQLARAEMAFLLGRAPGAAPGESPGELALRWQEADNMHRTELGRANPTQFYKQVPVCANCYRVYAELNRVRENGFRQAGVATTPRDALRPSKSTSALKARGGRAAQLPHAANLSTELYDQLFLAELAKHDDAETVGAGKESPAKDVASARPELEDAVARPPSASRSERAALPSLSSAKSRKKPHSTSSSGSSASLAGVRSSNNQFPSSSPGDDEELRTLRARAGRQEQELEQMRAKVALVESQKHQSEQRCAQIQSQCAAMLQEKDEHVRKQLLELEVAHSASQRLRDQTRSSEAAGSAANAADEVGKLIETIDALSVQIDQANTQKDLEVRHLAHAHQLETKRLHEKYQVDMETLRLGEHAAKEQVEAIQVQLLNLQNEAHVASTQARSTKAALEDLTKRKLAPLEEKNRRLERQLAELAAAGGASASASSAPAQDLAALERHLNNKIEYLKAQLASEMKCKEELGAHLAQVALSMEQLKKEKRQALLEQEDALKRQLQRAEESFAQERSVLAAQQAALQGKLVTLQANVTDLVQELTMWKSKEANARLAMEKVVEESVRTARQVADLEHQVETLLDERKHDAGGAASMSAKSASDETQRMQMEALLRRLDNERQYLKNQLESEQEAKEKCQRQAAALQSELEQLQGRLESAATDSEATLTAELSERLSTERQLRESVECLEESKLLLTRQLKDVQTKFAQAREQALLDRDEIEKVRIESNEMRSQLASARAELVKDKEYAKSVSERSSKALALVKSSLRAMEEEKAIQLRRLEDENTLFVKKLADTQAEMLVLTDKWAADKAAMKKQHALAALARVLSANWTRCCVRRQAWAFHRMALSSAVLRLQEVLDQRHGAAMQELEERLSNEFMERCDVLAQSLNDERLDTMRQLKERHDRDREELHAYYEQEKSQVLEDAERAQRERAELQAQTHAAAIEALEAQAAGKAAMVETQLETLQKEREALATAFAEVQTRCEELSSTLEAQSVKTEQQREAREAEWGRQSRELHDADERRRAEMETSAAARIEELKQLHAIQVQDMVDEYARERDARVQQAINEARTETAEKMRTLAELHGAELMAAEAQHRDRLEEEIRALTTRWQQELSDEREAHEKALKSALERVESRAQSQLDALQKEMNDRKGHAVVQCTSKWQKALEELQERLEVEKKVAYESGLQDREGEWQQAAVQIKQKQKEELESVQQEALRAIQAAEERHKMHFHAKLEQLAREFEEKHRREMAQLDAEITERVEQKARLALELEVQQAKVELEAGHARELEALRDDHHMRLERELATVSAGFEHEKMSLMERLEAAKRSALVELESEWKEKLEEVAHGKDAQAQRSLEELRSELSDDYEHDSQQLREALECEMATRLKELETRLLNEQEEAIAQVQDDSERLIEKVELAMTQLKAQKDAMEGELAKLRGALEEAEDAHFDAEDQLKQRRKHAAFHVLSLLMHARRRIESETQSHVDRMLELQAKHDHLDNDFTHERKQRSNEMAQIRAAWGQVQGKLDEMLKTLTNYKRDELVSHRSASGVLSNEISIVNKQMDEVREMKGALEKEIEQLQSEAQSVEASLRQLMVQSANSDSSSNGSSGLNMAVVAKKRRLNEEFEALLEQIERKKAEVRSVEKTFGALQTRRDAKELEMKAMERKLVEILVQQQKQLLALLSATRELAVPSPLVGESPAVS